MRYRISCFPVTVHLPGRSMGWEPRASQNRPAPHASEAHTWSLGQMGGSVAPGWTSRSGVSPPHAPSNNFGDWVIIGPHPWPPHPITSWPQALPCRPRSHALLALWRVGLTHLLGLANAPGFLHDLQGSRKTQHAHKQLEDLTNR